MNAVERVIKYSQTPSEAPLVIASQRPPAQWPDQGALDLRMSCFSPEETGTESGERQGMTLCVAWRWFLVLLFLACGAVSRVQPSWCVLLLCRKLGISLCSLPVECFNNVKSAGCFSCAGNVCMRYRADLPLVLDNITLAIRPREKIGLVGCLWCTKS